MKPKQVMLIAGEASGDMLAAELVNALRATLTAADSGHTTDSQPLRTGLEPRFFGAGGPRMAAAGVELAFDLTEHSIIGIPSVKEYFQGRQIFNSLVQLARDRQPDVIIGVDYNYFNLKFAHAIKGYVSARQGWFHHWRPQLVKLVSPQLWASRAGRVHQLAEDFDLLLSIFPFEEAWYAKHAPKFHVEFIGHPMVDRFDVERRGLGESILGTRGARPSEEVPPAEPGILLLPGSRKGELRRHVPVMVEALKLIRLRFPRARAKMVVPSEMLADLAKTLGANLELQVGDLPKALAEADVAISKTGTITMECAFFGVPTVAMYKAFWATYQVGKRIVKVKSLTMPNLLAGKEVIPEFIQDAATPENISRAALEFLTDEARRNAIKRELAEVVALLGPPGASERAAEVIAGLLEPGKHGTGILR